MKIGDRLKELRKSYRISQEELAKKLSTSRSSIGMFESNARIPTTDTLIKYSNFFDVSIDYLLGEDSPKEGIDYMRVNVYGSVPAGIPIEAIEDITDTEDLSFKDYDRNKTYIGLKVRGDSMYPKYLDGDTIIIEVTPCAENGQDTVVYVNGYEATLKRFHKSENGIITLEPLNTNYSPKSYGENDEPIKVLGIVKEIRRKV